MARTAPVPNLPPIPGMCPSVAVLAGGGDGGGGAGNGPGDGSGRAGAGTGKGGEGAESDARSAPAGAEGQASQGCPIDVITGAMYTLPASDFALPGPLPVDFVRVYRTSAVQRSCGLGPGWSHAYAWTALVKRSELVVLDAEGNATSFPRLEDGQSAQAPFGRRLTRSGDELVLATLDGLRRVFRTGGGDVARLAEIRDGSGNRVQVLWTGDEVSGLIDSVGRRVERHREGARQIWTAVAATADGRAYRKHLVTHWFDERGDLVRAEDPEGASTEYAYDEDHLMIAERRADGLCFRFIYESGGAPERRRCLETWGELDGVDVLEALGGRVDAGARGVFHVRFEYGPFPLETTAIDAVGGVHRYTGNALGLVTRYVGPRGQVSTLAYDDLGNILTAQDGLGHVEQRSYDGDGQVVSTTDALGGTVVVDRDERGHIRGVVDAGGGLWELRHDTAGRLVERVDPSGGVTSFTYNERGLTTSITGPGGGREWMYYDAHGNLIAYQTADGATWRYRYDLFGNVAGMLAPTGGEHQLHYNARGDLVTAIGPEGLTTTRRFDPLGRVIEETHPDGRSTRYRFVADVLVAREGPDGSVLRFSYDALLRPLAVVNAAGERHAFDRDVAGNVVREVTFAGQELSYRYDACDRCTTILRSDGSKILLEHDPLGRLVRRELPDGEVDAFEYSARGDLVRARGAAALVELERDACGRVVRETQEAGGRRFVVERAHDGAGHLASTAYSTGWRVGRTRGARGLVEALDVALGGARPERVSIGRDALGRELVRRREANQHALETTRDLRGRPTAILVRGDRGVPSRQRSFRWAPEGPLAEVIDTARGARTYGLDAAGRPLEIDGLGARESFRYAAQGTPLPAGRPRAIGAGGRIVRDGDVRLFWDRHGRLERREAPEPARSWTYRYDALDRLTEAESQGGARVRYTYDPLGRRLTEVRDGATTWFGWDGDSLVDERFAGGGAALRVFDDDGYTPLLCASAAEGGAADVALVATDAAGTPWFFLAERATAELDLTAWGEVAHARGEVGALRFAGQRADDATGLVYQNQRYYAPDLGVFITPDPLGIDASIFDIGFVPNATFYVDPLGLIILLTSDDPRVREAADARGKATGQSVIHHSALTPTSLAGHDHLEIVTHGGPGELQLGGKYVNGKQIGQLVKDNGFSGSSIQLTACNGGTRPYFGLGRSSAQHIANVTGVPVTAANGGFLGGYGKRGIVGVVVAGTNVGSMTVYGGGRWQSYPPR